MTDNWENEGGSCEPDALDNVISEVLEAPVEAVLIEWPRPVVLVDIDGTLADCTHRQHLVAAKNPGESYEQREARKSGKNWREFFARVDADTPIETVCEWVRNLPPDYDVVCVSGRSDECRGATETWLHRYNIPYTALFMRQAGDYRPDDVVKEEILWSLPFPYEQIAFVIDDRKRVVDMWRRNGLTCYQVADGDF